MFACFLEINLFVLPQQQKCFLYSLLPKDTLACSYAPKCKTLVYAEYEGSGVKERQIIYQSKTLN